MEIPCVQCGQRLRVPDGLRTVRLRCPACQYIFTTSTYDANVVEAELAPSETQTNRDAGSISINTEDYDVREYLANSPATPPEPIQKGAKTGWSVLFFIIVTLLLKGHNIVNFFQGKKKQPQPAVAKPIKREVGEDKKLGENLPPPKKSSRSKKQRSAPKDVVPAEHAPANPIPAESPLEIAPPK